MPAASQAERWQHRSGVPISEFLSRSIVRGRPVGLQIGIAVQTERGQIVLHPLNLQIPACFRCVLFVQSRASLSGVHLGYNHVLKLYASRWAELSSKFQSVVVDRPSECMSCVHLYKIGFISTLYADQGLFGQVNRSGERS